tara:strand:- start:10128 stop:10421 length:294 start_codon:yes stop_codon:yes gene_type:complete
MELIMPDHYNKALKKKKKKRKLRKISNKNNAGSKMMGSTAQTIVAGVTANKGKSRKQRLKLAGKMMVAGVAVDLATRAGVKAYNKYVDKVNKKRGYK